MIRNLTLITALMLSAEVVVPVLAPGLSVTSEATAADFTGRIKTIRIKKRRTGSGFKIVASVGADSSDSVAFAEITLSDAEGTVLEEITLKEPGRARLVTTAQDIPAPEGEAAVEVVLTLSGSTDDDVKTVSFLLSGDEPEDADADSGFKVRIRSVSDGALRVVVLHEDKDWDGGGVLGISAKSEGYEAEALEVEEVRQRLDSGLSDDFIFEDNVILHRQGGHRGHRRHPGPHPARRRRQRGRVRPRRVPGRLHLPLPHRPHRRGWRSGREAAGGRADRSADR